MKIREILPTISAFCFLLMPQKEKDKQLDSGMH
jgi:hypothetical protein